jgi:hypothetical protein
MSSYEDAHFQPLLKILPLEKDGYLTVQRTGEAILSEEEVADKKKSEDLTDFL